MPFPIRYVGMTMVNRFHTLTILVAVVVSASAANADNPTLCQPMGATTPPTKDAARARALNEFLQTHGGDGRIPAQMARDFGILTDQEFVPMRTYNPPTDANGLRHGAMLVTVPGQKERVLIMYTTQQRDGRVVSGTGIRLNSAGQVLTAFNRADGQTTPANAEAAGALLRQSSDFWNNYIEAETRRLADPSRQGENR
jgi:hypothetical protein